MEAAQEVLAVAGPTLLAVVLASQSLNPHRSGRTLTWLWTGRPVHRSIEPGRFRILLRVKLLAMTTMAIAATAAAAALIVQAWA